MSRKRLKDMLRKEMDERIKTYDIKSTPKQPEKPSLKFDLKTDLLGKKQEIVEPQVETEPIIKSILKETPSVKEPVEEPVVKEPAVKEQKKIFDKYLEEDDDDYTSSSDESDSYSEEEDDDYYKQYKNKVKQVEEKHNSRNDRRRVDDRDDRRIDRDDRRIDRDDRRIDRDDRKRDIDRDDRRIDRDDRKRDIDRDDRRIDRDDRRIDRDDRRIDRDDRKIDRDDRRIDRDDRKRDIDRDDIKSEPKVLKGNQFIDIPKKHILQVIKSKDVDSISADCVDEMKDILQDFTTHMFELFSDGDKVVIAERDDVKSYISLFIEDEDKELVDDLILSPKDIERAVMNIAEAYNVKIKKDIVYMIHTFLESILVKVITGAKMINEMSKTKRISGKELRTAYKIYML